MSVPNLTAHTDRGVISPVEVVQSPGESNGTHTYMHTLGIKQNLWNLFVVTSSL